MALETRHPAPITATTGSSTTEPSAKGANRGSAGSAVFGGYYSITPTSSSSVNCLELANAPLPPGAESVERAIARVNDPDSALEELPNAIALIARRGTAAQLEEIAPFLENRNLLDRSVGETYGKQLACAAQNSDKSILLSMIKSPAFDEQSKKLAIRYLTAANGEAGVDPLVSILTDDTVDSDLRREAASELESSIWTSRVDADLVYSQMIKTEDPQLKVALSSLAAAVGDERGMDELIRSTRGPNPFRAIFGEGRLSNALNGVWQGSQAVDANSARADAVRAIANLSGTNPQAESELTNILADPNAPDELRIAAITATLPRVLERPAVTQALRSILLDVEGNPELRRKVIENSPYPEIKDLLWEELNRPNSPNLRHAMDRIVDLQVGSETFTIENLAQLERLVTSGAKLGKDGEEVESISIDGDIRAAAVELLVRSEIPAGSAVIWKGLNASTPMDREVVRRSVGHWVASKEKQSGSAVSILAERFEALAVNEEDSTKSEALHRYSNALTEGATLWPETAVRFRPDHLEAILEMRQREPALGQPSATMVYPEFDYNQAFARTEQHIGELLKNGYHVRVHQVRLDEGEAKALEYTAQHGAADLNVILGHGTPSSIKLGQPFLPMYAADAVSSTQSTESQTLPSGNNFPDNHFVDLHDRETLLASRINESLKPGGQVVLISCSTGAETSNGENIQQMFRDIFPFASRVWAPQVDTQVPDLIFDKNHVLSDVRYYSHEDGETKSFNSIP